MTGKLFLTFLFCAPLIGVNTEIYIYAEFIPPIQSINGNSTLIFKVPAYYTRYYNKVDTNVSSCLFPILEKYKSKLTQYIPWRIRFTPNCIGQWKVKIYVQDTNGITIYPSLDSISFICINSSKLGFIAKVNSKYLKRTSGQGFFPVGENLTCNMYPCDTNLKHWEYGINELKSYIDSLSKYNGNFIRLWLDDYDSFTLLGRDWPTDTVYDFKNYNLKDACQIDSLIDYTYKKNIAVLLTLFRSESFINRNDTSNSNVFSYWDKYNPYRDISNCYHIAGPLHTPYGFFTDTAILQTRNYLRYIIARWSYATNILGWELWNEMDGIDKIQTGIPVYKPAFHSNVIKWHKKIYDYIKMIDPNKHLISTSFIDTGDSVFIDSCFKSMDFTTVHGYFNPVSNPAESNFQAFFYNRAQSYTTGIPPMHYYQFNKPFIIGEWGFSYVDTQRVYDPHGFDLHNSIWASAFSGSFGTALNYFWSRIDYVDRMHLYKLYRPSATFMGLLVNPLTEFKQGCNELYSRPKSGIRHYFMQNLNCDTIMGWTQDINFTFPNLYIHHPRYLQSFEDRPDPSSNIQTETIYPKKGNRFYNFYWYNSEKTFSNFQNPDSSYSLVTSNINGTRHWSYIPGNDSLTELTFMFPISLRRNSTFGDGVYFAKLDCSKDLWREGKLCNQPHDVKKNIVCFPSNSQVFYLSKWNQIRSIYWYSPTKSWGWSDLNNAADSVLGCLAVGPEENVYYINVNHALRCIYWDTSSHPNQWRKSFLCGAANSNVQGPIAVAPDGQVFFRTTQNNLNSIWFNPRTNCWERSTLNGATIQNVDSSIAISFIGQVFYKTQSGGLQNIWLDGKIWRRSNLDSAAWRNVCGNLAINWDTVFYKTCDNSINFIYWDRINNRWYGYDVPGSLYNVEGDLAGDYKGNIFYYSTDKNIFALHHTDFNCRWSLLDSATYYPYNSPTGMASEGGIAIDNYNNVFFQGRGDTLKDTNPNDTAWQRSDSTIHRLYYSNQCFQIPSYGFWRIRSTKCANIDTTYYISSIKTKTSNSELYDLFPNPAISRLTITSMSGQKLITITIYDLTYKVVRIINVNYEKNATFDVSFLPNGVYILKISSSEDADYYMKLIVNHE